MKMKEFFLRINNFKRENSKLVKDIKNVALMLFSSFLFLLLFANRAKLYPENIILYLEGKTKSFSVEESFPVKIDGAVSSINTIEDNIEVLTATSFAVLNSNGNVIRSENHSLENPRCKVGSLKTILYDVGGKNYRVDSVPKTLHKARAEENIISCDIADDGSYGVLTQSKGYLSEVGIYSSKNIEKYRYYFSQCQASDICMEPLGNKCAVSGITFENGKINSSIYLLDFKSEKPENIIELEDNIVTNVSYFQNGYILAVGDRYLAVVNPKGGLKKKFEYSDKALKSFSFDKQYGVLCCLTPSLDIKNDDEVVLIDNFGKCVTQIKTGQKVKDIAHTKNRIFCLTDDKILVYSTSGKSEGHQDTEKIFEKFALKSDSTLFAVQIGGSLEKIKINNLEK